MHRPNQAILTFSFQAAISRFEYAGTPGPAETDTVTYDISV